MSSQLTLDVERIESQVIEQAVEQIVQQAIGRGDLASRMESLLEDRLVALVDDVVGPVLEKGLDELVLAKTNEFGERKADDVSIREWVSEKCDVWMMQPVDMNGNPKDGDRWGRGGGETTRLAYLIEKYTWHKCANAIRDTVGAINEQVAPAIEKSLAMQVKQAVAAIKGLRL